jgi:hypothetical protein
MGKPIPKDTRRLTIMREESYKELKETPMTGEACTASGFSPTDLESFAYMFLDDKIKKSINDIKKSANLLAMLDDKNIFDEMIFSSEITNDTGALAAANYDEHKVTIYKRKILNNDINDTLIHEIAHLVCFRFTGLKGHCLDFAIINYCLRHYYCGGEIFFDSYDIHEDIAYRFLSINPNEFDYFIRNIRFESLRELSKKATTLANKIRERATPYGLYKFGE